MKGWNWLGGPLSEKNVDVFGEFVLSRVSSVFDYGTARLDCKGSVIFEHKTVWAIDSDVARDVSPTGRRS